MRHLSFFIIGMFLVISSINAGVTFHLNTSTAPGFADSTHTLVVRGSMNDWSGNNWQMTNVGGDYWTYTSDTLSDGEYEYKYVVIDNFDTESWESTNNRALTVTGETSLPQDYWENGISPPFTETDSIDVFFRVSTAGILGYDGDTMYIAGYMNSWTGEPLQQEGDSEFWSGHYTFDPDGGTVVSYKFQHGEGGYESINNRVFTTSSDTTLSWAYFNNEPPSDDEIVYSTITLTLTDEGTGFQDVRFKGTMTNWAVVQGYDDGTNGDEVAGDLIWTAVFEDIIGPNTYEWGAIDTDNGNGTTCDVCDGSDGYGNWLLNIIGEPNQEFTIEEDGSVSGSVNITIPYQGDPITKTVIFSVDMTEWLDEEGASGMPIFSLARGDQMQLRGGFNGWDCDDPADCEMTRTPGTNIFSIAASITGFPTNPVEYKYYLHLDSTSVDHLSTMYGDIPDYIGWENSPQYGGANRVFQLGVDDGTGLLELPLEGYYDLPAGGVVPCCRTVTLTFNVDMVGADSLGFNPDEDSVYLSLKDHWLKIMQGLGGGDHKMWATPNGDGTYSASPSFVGPFPWHMIYTWGFYDVSELAYIEEGGGFGYGASRARYHHANANNDCWWRDFNFPIDTWHPDAPMPLEPFEPDSICIPLAGIDESIIPSEFFLSNNYPNPFNPNTSFNFGVPGSSDINISIYNILGQKIFGYDKTGLEAGTYEFNWNGKDQYGKQVTTGIYFYEIKAGKEFQNIKKMTFLK